MGSMTSPEQEAAKPACTTPPESSATEIAAAEIPAGRPDPAPMPKEIGGPAGPEPTRFGDWERKGRVSDF